MTIWSFGNHGKWIWMLISLLNSAAAQRDGYLSIDCGASASFTDPKTGISWVTDEPYISTGINEKVKFAVSSPLNNGQLQTLRYFPPDKRKHCYNLPASKNSSYLLRAMFVHGRFQDQINNSFHLSVDATMTDSMDWTELDVNRIWYHEHIVAATSDQISFCLVPKVGNPFISTLELRPLAVGMYDVVFNGKYLKMISRVNFGVLPTDPIVRYPDDPYDIFWFPFKEDSNISTTKTTAYIDVSDNIFDRPPMVVMQSAWVGPLSLRWFTPISDSHLEKTRTFYINEFFAEIQHIGPTDTRIVDIALNDEFQLSCSVGSSTTQVFYKEISLTKAGADFTFAANPDSTLSALLNAAEIYASRDTVRSTDERDVTALEMVKTNLGLTSWTGDPCLPVPYDWLTCDQGTVTRITKINLSNFSLVGTIPKAIAELTALTDLWLDNNKIKGVIPDLSKLTKLKTLRLQNNALSGGVPSTLASLFALTEFFVSFSGLPPAALASGSGFKLETSRSNKVLGIIVGFATNVVAALAIASLWYFCKRSPKPTPLAITDPESEVSSSTSTFPGAAVIKQARAFTLTEVQDATDGYRTKIGEDGFGHVYYRRLSDGTELTVKINSETSCQETMEFANEVSVMLRVHHGNLLPLLGHEGKVKLENSSEHRLEHCKRYFEHKKLTQKSDVYSFGVVLLEIICGIPPNSPNQADPKICDLVDWARSQLNDGDLDSIVDPEIRGTYDVGAMWKVAKLAMTCVEPEGVNRPDMNEVVRKLTVVSEMEKAKSPSTEAGLTEATAAGGRYGTTRRRVMNQQQVSIHQN